MSPVKTRFALLVLCVACGTLVSSLGLTNAGTIPAAPRADVPVSPSRLTSTETRPTAVRLTTTREREAILASTVYSAETLRVIDGDTVEMRIAIWLGQEVVTRIRLRDIDAPELKARCEAERVKAEAAKSRLETLLTTRSIAVTEIGYDKYGGRVLGRLLGADGEDLGARLVAEGLARPYAGGRREGWCEGDGLASAAQPR